MTTTDEIRHSVHKKLLIIRNIYTTVNLSKFEEAFKCADDSQKLLMLKYIDECKHDALIKLIENIIYDSSDLEYLSVRELRKIAQECSVIGYNILPKASLLSAIKSYERTHKIIRRDGRPIIQSQNIQEKVIQTQEPVRVNG